MKINPRKIVYTIFSLGITVGIFSYLLTSVSPGDVLDILRGVPWNFLGMFLVLSLASALCRAWRYKVVLEVAGHTPGTFSLFLVTIVRNLFADLLPARLGDLVYIYIGTSRLGIPFGSAASSFALAFLFDILALVPLVLFALWSIQGSTAMSSVPFLVGGAILATVTVLIIYSLPKLVRIGATIVAACTFLPKKWQSGIKSGLVSLIESLDTAKRAGVYTRLLILSICVRLGKYVSFYLFLCGMLIPLGYSWEQMPFSKVFLGMFASELSASLPMSGIAGFGAYEGTWALTFELLGFPSSDAKLTAVSHHLFTQVYGYLIGIAALLLLLLPVFKVVKDQTVKPRKSESARWFYGKVGALVIVALVAIFFLNQVSSKHTSKFVRIHEAETPTDTQQSALSEIAKSFPGEIVFDSNRSGSFGIYVMKPDGSGIRALVDSDWQERFPDPSPDGQWIVYGKSHTTFRLAPSEVWIVDREGKNPRQLNSHGNFPTFSADGKTVYFERDRKGLFAVDFDGSNERKLLPKPGGNFRKAAVVMPRVTTDGKKVVFTTDKPDRWNTWIVDLETGNGEFTVRACEASWWGDDQKLVYINKTSAKSKSGIYGLDLSNKEISTLQDGGEPRGHEYFPGITKDGRYLLYSACPVTQHDHDTANYEIFIKDLASGLVAQLTFDGFTNRWPKLIKTENK